MTSRGVSVVIPTRNRKALLSRALRCTLVQEDVDVEVIVVDEASSDGTPRYLAALDDDRLRVIRHDKPLGVARARNAGLDAATRRWVAFLDDDDMWAPSKLAHQLAILADQPEARWSCVGAVTVDSSLRVISAGPLPPDGEVTSRLLQYNCIPGGGSGVLASTELAREVGGFDPQLTNLADREMWLRLSLRSPVAGVDRPLVGYLCHPHSLSHDLSDIHQELRHIRAKHADVRAARAIAENGAYQLRWMAQMHARSGQRVEAARSYLQLARHHGDRRSFLRAAATGVWPGSIRLGDRNGRRRVPPAWLSEAEDWLAPLRKS